jgi:hypothetical protein
VGESLVYDVKRGHSGGGQFPDSGNSPSAERKTIGLDNKLYGPKHQAPKAPPAAADPRNAPVCGVGWWCYCGTPPCAYRADGKEVDPPPGEVFLVFVNDASVASNWRWDRADPDNSRLPNGHETRFRKRVL